MQDGVTQLSAMVEKKSGGKTKSDCAPTLHKQLVLTILSARQVSGALMSVSHTSMARLTGKYRAPS